MSKPMTVSKLIKVLSKMQAEHGDAEISIYTEEGGSCSLYSEDDIHYGYYLDKSGNKIPLIEIG